MANVGRVEEFRWSKTCGTQAIHVPSTSKTMAVI